MAGLPTGSIRRPRNAWRGGGAAAFGRPLACQTNARWGPSAPGGRCARCARPPPPRSAGRRTCPWAVQPPAYRPSLAIGASRFGSGGKQYRPHAYLPQSNTLRAASKPKGIKTLRGSRSPGRSLAYAPSFLLGPAERGGRRRLAGPWPAKPTPTGGLRPPVGVVRAARARRPPRPAGCYFLPKGE